MTGPSRQPAISPVAEAAHAPAMGGSSAARALVRTLRLHQWSKNLLVLLPIAAAHHLWDRQALLRVALAFLSFGLVASGLYVLNDILDVESDRRHPRKRARPFASGALPLRAGFVLVPALLAAGAGGALLLPPLFGAVLAGYAVTTTVYSFVLKRAVVLDVVSLAVLYAARIYAGALAADVPVSEWLASFSFFFFLSLAAVKRTSEMGTATELAPGRGYRAADRVPMSAMGMAAGYVSVLVLALYVTSPGVLRLYSHPGWLWGLCVLVTYWISRVWLLAWRGEVHDDPVVFALSDRATWVVAVLAGLVTWLGT